MGRVEPEVLRDIYQYMRQLKQNKAAFDWPFMTTEHGPARDIFLKCMPVHNLVMKAAGRRARTITYDIDTTTVRRKWAQRGGMWHADYPEHELKLLVADALPTEVMIIDKEADLKPEAVARRKFLLSPQGGEALTVLPDEALKDYGLKLYQPEPYAVMAIYGHIHRSTVNTTKKPIPRCWIRAAIS